MTDNCNSKTWQVKKWRLREIQLVVKMRITNLMRSYKCHDFNSDSIAWSFFKCVSFFY